MRNRVLFPEPSGPISPNSSPRSTEKETAFKASTLPYRLLIPDIVTIGSIISEFHFTIHAYLSRTIVVERDFYGIDLIRAFIIGQNRFRRKFGLV